VDERAADGYSGVGDDGVDPAIRVTYRRRSIRERALVGDVNLPPAGVRPARGGDAGKSAWFEAEQRYPRAAAGQAPRDGSTDPPRRTGDHHDLTG
jgi:hypothetical protein